MSTAFSDQNSVLSNSLNSLFPYELENAYFNELLSVVKSGSPQPNGTCNDDYIQAHSEVRSVALESVSPVQLPFLNTDTSSNGNYCEIHLNETLNIYCDTCTLPICNQCAMGLHAGHTLMHITDAFEIVHRSSIKLLADTKVAAEAVKEGYDMTQKMFDAVNIKSDYVIREIHSFASNLCSVIKERESELLKRLENVRATKLQMLNKQSDGLKETLFRFTANIERLANAVEHGSIKDLSQARTQALYDFTQLTQSVRVALSPQEDDLISFVPDVSLLRAASTFGEIDAKSFNPCSILPDHFVQMSLSSLVPLNKITSNEISSGHNLLASLVDDNRKLTTNFEDRMLKESPFQLIKQDFPRRGNHLSQRRNGVSNSPPVCVLMAKMGNIYNNVALTFGKEGDGDGELCRPWGVCCDRDSNVVVADRSNNRIQIFRSDGSFLRKFGVRGNEHGQFDRPAGVTVNSLNHIVVADKDNHRIQVFTSEGRFIFTFGEKGSRNSQFHYPWDVAVGPENRILVSDTRNHRIQLFNSDGSFLNKYGFENTSSMWKHFDSPRGVCFGPDSAMIITDFNNHRLVIVDKNFVQARFLGSEGSNCKQFLRPQGLAIDQDGHLIVADSRNNRIQVFESSGNFLWQFGTSGKEPGQLDRPSGICLTPDGKIVVVDFGNNRIQIF